MNEEKGLLKREIKEKTSFDGIVVGRRRLYVYSENYRKK